MTYDPKKTVPFQPPLPGRPLAAMVVMLHAEYDDPTFGGWCNACMLPSMVTVKFRVVTQDGTVVSSGEMWRCDGGCGEASQ